MKSFHRVWMIAQNSFMEARYNKVLHIALGFAAILIVFSLFLGQVSLHQNIKVVKDVGMATISLFGIFVAIFLGVNSLYRELEHRTIYAIVSKPIRRFEILLGKYLGMLMVLTTSVVAMTLFLYVVTVFIEHRIDWNLLPALALILIELFIVAALGIFFSSFSTPFLSGFFTMGLFLVGRVSSELGAFGERSDDFFFRLLSIGVQKVFDLQAFNLRAEVVHGIPIYREDFWLPIFYAFFLIVIVLFVSFQIFKKRDFK
jgi:ABC-type transport system involved in multi-copper enzyme maturation permease subunit